MQEPSNRIGEGVGQVSYRCHFPIGLNGCRGRFLAGRFGLGSVRVVALRATPFAWLVNLPGLVRGWRANQDVPTGRTGRLKSRGCIARRLWAFSAEAVSSVTTTSPRLGTHSCRQ